MGRLKSTYIHRDAVSRKRLLLTLLFPAAIALIMSDGQSVHNSMKAGSLDLVCLGLTS